MQQPVEKQKQPAPVVPVVRPRVRRRVVLWDEQ